MGAMIRTIDRLLRPSVPLPFRVVCLPPTIFLALVVPWHHFGFVPLFDFIFREYRSYTLFALSRRY